MALIVKKFGGSSVATPEKIKQVAQRVLRDTKPGDQVAVVVSAMGDTTDDLLTLVRQVTNNMPLREMDMLLTTGEQVSIALLAAAFETLGQPACSFTGAQAGILTNKNHTKARILSVDGTKVKAALNAGKVAVIAGFQGVTEYGEITTLGRGGSDTTAVAIAGALKADTCEIFTDVDGVYSADPRIVPDARKMQEVTYSEMLEMARLGAGVMQPRAVELGERGDVIIHVRSTFSADAGTMIRREYTMQEKDFVIRGVAHDANVAKIAVLGVPDQPGIAHQIFSALANENIDVDMIVQSVRNSEQNIIDLLFTVAKPELDRAVALVKTLQTKMGFLGVQVDTNVAKISVVGAGMLGNPGIAATMFGALADANINIGVISTSEISISCLIGADQIKEAANAVHARFFPPKK